MLNWHLCQIFCPLEIKILLLLCSEENKYIKQVYNMMLDNIAIQPLKQNWASCVKDLLSSIRFYGSLGITRGWQYRNNFECL